MQSSTIAQAMHAATFQNRNTLPTAVADDRTRESMNIRLKGLRICRTGKQKRHLR